MVEPLIGSQSEPLHARILDDDDIEKLHAKAKDDEDQEEEVSPEVTK